MAENVDLELNKYKEEAEGIMKANGVSDMAELEYLFATFFLI